MGLDLPALKCPWPPSKKTPAAPVASCWSRREWRPGLHSLGPAGGCRCCSQALPAGLSCLAVSSPATGLPGVRPAPPTTQRRLPAGARAACTPSKRGLDCETGAAGAAGSLVQLTLVSPLNSGLRGCSRGLRSGLGLSWLSSPAHGSEQHRTGVSALRSWGPGSNPRPLRFWGWGLAGGAPRGGGESGRSLLDGGTDANFTHVL